MSECADFRALLDARLLGAMDIPLLRALESSRPLLDFLRSFTNDADFKASIEMAMSKDASICDPAVLENGRPSEALLSKLSSARAYLSKYINRVDYEPRLLDLLQTLVRVNVVFVRV